MLKINQLNQFFKNTKILYVEDDANTLENMKEILSRLTDYLYCANSFDSAVKILNEVKVNLIITDIEMPNKNGIELIKYIRKNDLLIPIIVQTAYKSNEYLYECANLNVQAYLYKPITYLNLKEVFVKISRYLNNVEIVNLPLNNDLEYSFSKNQIINKNGEELKITKKEMELFELLLKNKDRYVTFEEIENTVWDNESKIMTDASLRTLIESLRKKIGKDLIINLSGIGYKIVLND